MQIQLKLLLLLFLTISQLIVNAQPGEAKLKVYGEVITPLSITAVDFKTYKQVELKHKDREGKEHIYSGVLVGDVLQKAGVTMGDNLKGINLTKFVLAEAADGYRVAFALVEFDKAFTDKVIILADKVDGKSLASTEGPYRIIVQDEKKPTRFIRQVTALRIGFAK